MPKLSDGNGNEICTIMNLTSEDMDGVKVVVFEFPFASFTQVLNNKKYTIDDRGCILHVLLCKVEVGLNDGHTHGHAAGVITAP